MNGPFLLVRATIAFATLGLTLWTRLLGPRRGKILVFGGMAVSTLVAVLIEVTR